MEKLAGIYCWDQGLLKSLFSLLNSDFLYGKSGELRSRSLGLKGRVNIYTLCTGWEVRI